LHFGAPSSVEESATHAYDRTALRWLGWASVPFVLGSAAWSLAFYEHRSWYSWALSSVATAVYVGGFLLMTPQLFVNYKLKSVAHLPVRVFIYRACGTFIGQCAQNKRGWCIASVSGCDFVLTRGLVLFLSVAAP
jgi:hypothetical protein